MGAIMIDMLCFDCFGKGKLNPIHQFSEEELVKKINSSLGTSEIDEFYKWILPMTIKYEHNSRISFIDLLKEIEDFKETLPFHF